MLGVVLLLLVVVLQKGLGVVVEILEEVVSTIVVWVVLCANRAMGGARGVPGGRPLASETAEIESLRQPGSDP